MTYAIQARGLSKQYRIGQYRSGYTTLREEIVGLGERLVGRRGSREINTIWALRELDFDIEEGEVVGIIGRNGAGKTTLLRLLSRITEPTEGFADVRGRVGSLLEVGTGFHPELTGRENIYLNGAILGMRRHEIERRFEEIVAFAGVEKFIDTPVKRYSSGMYVRLAFSVAAHLETEILIVDEVLAVGDYAFQQKCLGSMRDAAGSGRTVLFVSHNMPAVAKLCDRAILLNGGKLEDDGPVESIVRQYLRVGAAREGAIPDVERPVGTGEVRFRRVAIVDADGRSVGEVPFGEPVRVRFMYEVLKPVPDAAFEIGISDPDRTRIATATTLDRGGSPLGLELGLWETEVVLEMNLLPREYQLDLAVHHWLESKLTIDWLEGVLTFRGVDVGPDAADHYIRFATNYSTSNVRGFVRPRSEWKARRPADA